MKYRLRRNKSAIRLDDWVAVEPPEKAEEGTTEGSWVEKKRAAAAVAATE